MKKLTAFCVTLVLALAATFGLAGCGGDGRIEIKIGMWPDPVQKDDVAMFNEWKEQFERDNPEYKVTPAPYTYAPDTFFSKAETGTLPTVFQTWFTEPQKLIANRYVKDVTEELKELGWYDKMDPDMREALSAEGRVYGVPRDGYGMGLFLNTEILADVGVLQDVDGDGSVDLYDENGTPMYPTTFDALYETACLVRDAYEGDVAGMVILSANNNGGWQFSNMAWNFGAKLQVQDANGKWQANLADSGAVAALEWVKKMKWEGCLPAENALSYQDWYRFMGAGNAAMCFAGSDAIAMPVTNFNMKRENIAFVPMPAGPGGDRYALYGGTPYMFSSRATDEQVKGALKFLEYMGRSPETSEISRNAVVSGNETAKAKGMPILPTIKPWVNEDYLAMTEEIESRYVNMDVKYFEDFFDNIGEMKHSEEPNYCQDMYKLLDSCIMSVFQNENAVPQSLLASASSTFQTMYLNQLK